MAEKLDAADQAQNLIDSIRGKLNSITISKSNSIATVKHLNITAESREDALEHALENYETLHQSFNRTSYSAALKSLTERFEKAVLQSAIKDRAFPRGSTDEVKADIVSKEMSDRNAITDILLKELVANHVKFGYKDPKKMITLTLYQGDSFNKTFDDPKYKEFTDAELKSVAIKNPENPVYVLNKALKSVDEIQEKPTYYEIPRRKLLQLASQNPRNLTEAANEELQKIAAKPNPPNKMKNYTNTSPSTLAYLRSTNIDDPDTAMHKSIKRVMAMEKKPEFADIPRPILLHIVVTNPNKHWKAANEMIADVDKIQENADYADIPRDTLMRFVLLKDDPTKALAEFLRTGYDSTHKFFESSQRPDDDDLNDALEL